MDFPAQYARTRRFTLGTPRSLSLTTDGSRAYFLRSKSGEDSVLCLWRLDRADGTSPARGHGGAEEVLVADPRALLDEVGQSELVPEAERARRERARESADGIVDFSMSPDGRIVVFALNGDLYRVDRNPADGNPADRNLTRLPTTGSVFDPRIDPTGTAVAYVTGDTLRVVELDRTADDHTVAGDDDPLVVWGRAEFVAAEEMNRTRGYWWSPDGAHLLATRVDNRQVDRWWIADPANPDRPPTEVRYPAAGTTNASVELWLCDRRRPLRAIDWSDAGRYEYLADVVWVEGHPPLIVRQTRDQRTVSIASIDPHRGTIEEVHRVTDEVWVELVSGSPCRLGHDLLTIEDVTDGDGDRRALCLSGPGLSGPDRSWRPVTDPSVNVRSLVGVDQTVEPPRVFITAWTDPTEVHLAAVEPHSGAIEWLTTEPGVHTATSQGSVLAVTSMTPDRPGVELRLVQAGEAGRELRLVSHVEVPMITVKPRWMGSGPELRSVLFLPSDHDGVTSLPVLLDPYGGPHAQRVLKVHNGHLVSQWFADQGFAVLVTDGRGTPGRGPRFERAVWGDLAQPVLDDQIEALDRAASRLGFLDVGRVGIRGWSFGGYLAALAVLRRPDRVHAAIAGAPVTTWRLYDTHYTERYLGHPDQHPEHYDRTDLLLDAERLERPLLLVHGLADDNVVAAHTLRLSTALLVHGRPHSVMPLSGVTHMTPQVATAENLLRLELEFLTSALGTRP